MLGHCLESLHSNRYTQIAILRITILGSLYSDRHCEWLLRSVSCDSALLLNSASTGYEQHFCIQWKLWMLTTLALMTLALMTLALTTLALTTLALMTCLQAAGA